MICACLEAHEATGDQYWLAQANKAFEWFHGSNDLGLAVYDAQSGGRRDGLHIDRANPFIRLSENGHQIKNQAYNQDQTNPPPP